jgi:hypothetical protein
METEAQRLRAKHRNELLRTGRAWPAPKGLFYSFQKYLDSLPWGVSQVDERRIEGAVRVNRDRVAAADLAGWLADVRIARRPRVGAYWGIFDPVIVIDTAYALQSLDWLTSYHPMGLFLFGIEQEQGKWTPHFEDWLQYDGGSHFIAIR